MKKQLTLLILSLCTVSWLGAQIQTPAASPLGKVEQRVGLTDISVEYSRPSMKGREIFGGLVPYDEVWRTGANAVTKVTFSDDVMVGGAEVKKGSYALLTKPGKEEWKVMLYPHNSNSYGSYLESDVTPTTVTAKAWTMPEGVAVETFMMGFDNLTNNSADLYMLWDKTYVPVTITTHTDKAVMASIDKAMGGPSGPEYYSAASYYLSEKKDMKQALEWINKAISKDYERFWVLRTKSLIQAELGDKAGAIASAMKSKEMAEKEGNAEFVRMNEESIAEWKK